jgi:hypothetical protein
MFEPLPGFVASDLEVSHELVEKLVSKYSPGGVIPIIGSSVDGGSDWFSEPLRKRLNEPAGYYINARADRSAALALQMKAWFDEQAKFEGDVDV